MQSNHNKPEFYKNMSLLIKDFQDKEKSQLYLQNEITKLREENVDLKTKYLELEGEILSFNIFFKNKLDSINSIILNESEFEETKSRAFVAMISLINKVNNIIKIEDALYGE
jgi:hypothetical protein